MKRLFLVQHNIWYIWYNIMSEVPVERGKLRINIPQHFPLIYLLLYNWLCHLLCCLRGFNISFTLSRCKWMTTCENKSKQFRTWWYNQRIRRLFHSLKKTKPPDLDISLDLQYLDFYNNWLWLFHWCLLQSKTTLNFRFKLRCTCENAVIYCIWHVCCDHSCYPLISTDLTFPEYSWEDWACSLVYLYFYNWLYLYFYCWLWCCILDCLLVSEGIIIVSKRQTRQTGNVLKQRGNVLIMKCLRC